ncbi:uncharacterized protein LOC107019358 [Solanum pennellii]|uniref:Uncharacterized protein LOC107019358 n=1 Tax=Solanum pennellii TaxID=28526 RepID=A0ABM1GSQ1_SOLPN|nr:uncharacterized protein LOC107019358 [Solanum pennellii]
MAEMYEAWMRGQAPPSSICLYPHTHQYSSPVEAKRAVKNEEHEEMSTKMKCFEQNVRDMRGFGGHKSVSINYLCMVPHVHLSIDFKTPVFEKYDGHGNPFIDQDTSNWHTWDDLARYFGQQFQYNIDIVPDRTLLANMRKKTIENFREYAIRWREQVTTVKPPMKESEMIVVFLQAQEPNYFHYLLSIVGKTFAKVIKIGELVENSIKLGRIVSQAALKATTQVIKNGSGNLGGKKLKEDVVNVVSDKQKSPSSPFYQYAPPQYHYYIPMQNTQYSMIPPQYAVSSAQPHVYPPNNYQ